MKNHFLATSALVLLSFNVHAGCKVFVPVKEFVNAGRSISFDFTLLFSQKNYTEVYSQEEGDHEILISGIESEGRFHKAIAVMQMGEIEVKESVTCFTQYCAVSDYGKAFSRSWKKFSKLLPHCQSKIKKGPN